VPPRRRPSARSGPRRARPEGLFRIANGVMAVLFAFAAAVQDNDPDPLRWMAMYGLGMLACGLALAGRLPRLLPALAGLGALVWAATLAPGVVGRVSVGELFSPTGC
jgi:hypothetical protein